MSAQSNFFDKRKSKKNRTGRPRKRPELAFGGSYFKTYKPREQRPIFAKKALHIVLRSSLARGKYSMRSAQNEEKIWDIIVKHANINGIQIYEYANAGNHLHLLVRVKRRDAYCRFIRSITGIIARTVKGCEKGKPLLGQFWDARPFTRVVQFAGQEFKKVKYYLARNNLEALGFIKYQPRTLKKTNEWKLFWQYYSCIP